MDDEIPSLQQICYEILAQFAGYIEEIDCINSSEIYEICIRANPFGLANMESLFSPSLEISTDSIWQTIFLSKTQENKAYITSLSELIKGPDFYRQAVLSSLLRFELSINEMDDEDLAKLISLCSGLKAVEINKLVRLSPGIVLGSFNNLMHASLENSKLGEQSAEHIKDLILRNSCLQTLNLKNCCLGDRGALVLVEGLQHCIISSLNLCWNDLTFTSIEPICRLILIHTSFRIVDLSRNNIMRALKPAQRLVNEIRQTRSIDIKVV